MKAFSEQFRQCKEEDMLGIGPTFPYTEYPEFLPLSPKKAKLILSLENELPTIACLRFGGVCNSGKEECKKLRGVPIPKDYVDDFKEKYERKNSKTNQKIG